MSIELVQSYTLVGQTERERANMETGNRSRLYLAASVCNLITFSAGIALGWTSPSLPKLTGEEVNDSPLTELLTAEEASWVGSLIALGATLGPLPAGILADKIGRKKTMLLTSVPFIVGWILIATASSVAQLYAARLLFGVGVGSVFTVVPMYIGEISEDEVRGKLGSFVQLFIVGGLLYVYVIGPYVSYLVLTIFGIVVPAIFAVGLIFCVPESPYYLLVQKKHEDAALSLQILRGKSREGVNKELSDMQICVEEAMRDEASIKDLVATKGNIKGLYLSCGLVAFQQLSGINVVLFYGQSIFQKTGSDLPAAVANIILGVVQLLASCATPLLADRLGRRLLLHISGIGMAVGLTLLGTFFKLDADKSDVVSSISWLPVLSMIIYMLVYCVGFGPLPWAVMGEMFPANIKSKASTITASFCWLLAFFITKYFSVIEDKIGTHFAFWIFAICCLIATAFVFFLLPETKGKSLQEIQDVLNGNTSTTKSPIPIQSVVIK